LAGPVLLGPTLPPTAAYPLSPRGKLRSYILKKFTYQRRISLKAPVPVRQYLCRVWYTWPTNYQVAFCSFQSSSTCSSTRIWNYSAINTSIPARASRSSPSNCRDPTSAIPLSIYAILCFATIFLANISSNHGFQILLSYNLSIPVCFRLCWRANLLNTAPCHVVRKNKEILLIFSLL